MTIKPIRNKLEWENFLGITQPHTFLQSWNWGQVQEKVGQKIFRYGIEINDQLVGVALFILIKARRGSFLFCPHGPIFRDNIDLTKALTALLKEIRKLASENHCAFIRFSPLLSATAEHQNVFKQLGFRAAPIHMMHPELAWLIRVNQSDDELLRGMRKTTRYCLRKAEKEGVTVESSPITDLEEFWEIYSATAARHSFVPFSKPDLQTELEIFSADNQAQLILAKHEGQLIAGAVIIYYGGSGFYHHGASRPLAKNLTTTSYLLQWRAIQETRRRGLKFYNFWGITDGKNKNHPWAGITLFKTGFGGFSEQYLHAQDLAISPKYWFTYIIEKIRTIWRGYA
jgi:peptidoglycan pentaglycine glycine transferase (the first glycine)